MIICPGDLDFSSQPRLSECNWLCSDGVANELFTVGLSLSTDVYHSICIVGMRSLYQLALAHLRQISFRLCSSRPKMNVVKHLNLISRLPKSAASLFTLY